MDASASSGRRRVTARQSDNTIPPVSSKLARDPRGRLVAIATTTTNSQTRGDVFLVLGNTCEPASLAPWTFLGERTGRLPLLPARLGTASVKIVKG